MAPALVAGGLSLMAGWFLLPAQERKPIVKEQPPAIERGQTSDEAIRRSSGCVSCHGLTDSPSMHTTNTVQLACIDCHGGNNGKITGLEGGTTMRQLQFALRFDF